MYTDTVQMHRHQLIISLPNFILSRFYVTLYLLSFRVFHFNWCRVYVCVRACVRACVCVCVCVRARVRMHVTMYTWLYVCFYVCSFYVCWFYYVFLPMVATRLIWAFTFPLLYFRSWYICLNFFIRPSLVDAGQQLSTEWPSFNLALILLDINLTLFQLWKNISTEAVDTFP